MYSSLQKDHQRRQRYRGEQRVSGNVLNVLSLTDVRRIHHLHLDRALITELCRLLNTELRSLITPPTSRCITTAFVQLFHLSDSVRIAHGAQDVCTDTSVVCLPTVSNTAMDKNAWTGEKQFF